MHCTGPTGPWGTKGLTENGPTTLQTSVDGAAVQVDDPPAGMGPLAVPAGKPPTPKGGTPTAATASTSHVIHEPSFSH
jgi:hypothetical protein